MHPCWWTCTEDSIGMALKHYTDTCRDVTAIWFTNAYLHYIVPSVWKTHVSRHIFSLSKQYFWYYYYIFKMFLISQSALFLSTQCQGPGSMCMCWFPRKISTDGFTWVLHFMILHAGGRWDGFYMWRLKVPDSFIHKCLFLVLLWWVSSVFSVGLVPLCCCFFLLLLLEWVIYDQIVICLFILQIKVMTKNDHFE